MMTPLERIAPIKVVLRVVTSVPEISAAVLETFGQGGLPLGVETKISNYIGYVNTDVMHGVYNGIEGDYLRTVVNEAFSVGLQHIAETQPVVNAEVIRVERPHDEFGEPLTWEPFMLEVDAGEGGTRMQELGDF